MKVMLKNSYHKTEICVYAKDLTLTRRQVENAKDKLCGSKDCPCSNSLGIRGDCLFEQSLDYKLYQDGSAQFFKRKIR